MIGKIFITRKGYDPQLGKHVKDPYLGDNPSLGACRPDIRRQVIPGDHIFTISGKVRRFNQFVMGGFEVASKIDPREAYQLFPEQHLREREDGQVTGNIVIDSQGRQHPLDTHDPSPPAFARRIQNYVIGKNPIVLVTPEEIARGREQTLEVLCEILKKHGKSPIDLVGRWGCKLTEDQVIQLRAWLRSLKQTH
jgi:hypothetical protein